MNATQRLSLQLIEELLNSMDDETFLREHESVERNIGPTIEEYLSKSKYPLSGFVQTMPEYKEINAPCEIKQVLHKGQNDSYASNNELYSEQLAA